MICQVLFRPPQHCMLMISAFGKVIPTSNSSNISVKNLSLWVNRWCTQSGFKIATSKTTAVIFTKKRKPEPIQLVFESTTVTLRKEYKYSGVIFQSNGLYHAHIQNVFDKCQKRLNVVRLLRGTSWGAAKAPLLTISRILMRSVVEYGMEAYFSSRSSLTPLFRVQSNALHLCAGAISSTPNLCLQHACHEMPLHIKHRLLCLQYKVHLLTFRDNPGLTLVNDCWQELFPDTQNFCSFNMFTKQIVLLSHPGVCRFLTCLPGPCMSQR